MGGKWGLKGGDFWLPWGVLAKWIDSASPSRSEKCLKATFALAKIMSAKKPRSLSTTELTLPKHTESTNCEGTVRTTRPVTIAALIAPPRLEASGGPSWFHQDVAGKNHLFTKQGSPYFPKKHVPTQRQLTSLPPKAGCSKDRSSGAHQNLCSDPASFLLGLTFQVSFGGHSPRKGICTILYYGYGSK